MNRKIRKIIAAYASDPPNHHQPALMFALPHGSGVPTLLDSIPDRAAGNGFGRRAHATKASKP